MDNFDKIRCIMFNHISNVYYLDLDIYKWQRSILNIAMKISYLTSYLMVSVMLVLSVTIYKIIVVEIVRDHGFDI